MAEIVNINTDNLIQAAATVADHLAAAAIPPADALPPAMAPSPVDLAAAGVDTILQAKIDSAATGLADKGSELDGASADTAGGLRGVDANGADRIAAVPDTD